MLIVNNMEKTKANYYNEYTIWASMIGRCKNTKHKQAHRYSLRGITVSDSWKDFEYFIRDMGPRPSKEYSLDRINPDGNYCKENCRWATYLIQAMNKPLKTGRASKYRGVTKTKSNKWVASIGYKYNDYRLGTFKTEVDAALAYNKKAIELHGEFACLNDV